MYDIFLNCENKRGKNCNLAALWGLTGVSRGLRGLWGFLRISFVQLLRSSIVGAFSVTPHSPRCAAGNAGFLLRTCSFATRQCENSFVAFHCSRCSERREASSKQLNSFGVFSAIGECLRGSFGLGFFEDPFLSIFFTPGLARWRSLGLGLNKRTSSRVAEHLRCSFSRCTLLPKFLPRAELAEFFCLTGIEGIVGIFKDFFCSTSSK